MKTVSTKLGMFNLYLLRSTLADTVVYRLCPRKGAFLRGAFFRSFRPSWSCRKRVLLKHPPDREGGDPLHRVIAIAEELPAYNLYALLCAAYSMWKYFSQATSRLASKFQTSCFWNPTRATLAKATARVSCPRLRMHLSINLMNEKKFVRGVWYLLAVDVELQIAFDLWLKTDEFNRGKLLYLSKTELIF